MARLKDPGRFALERVVGWLAVSAMVFLIAVGAGFALYTRAERLAKAEADTVATAGRLAENAARLFDAADFVLKSVRRQVAPLSWPEIEYSRELWQDLAEQVRLFPYLQAIWLNDRTGRLRLTTFTFPTPFNVAADRDFFRAHIEPNDDAYVSALIVGRITGRPSFLMTRRLSEPDGTMRGIVSVTITSEYFAAFFTSLTLGHDPRIILFREGDGGVLVRQPGPLIVEGTVVTPALREAIRQAPERGVEQSDGRLRAYHRLDPWPLYVAASINLAAVEAEWLDFLLPYGGALLLALAALAALSAFAFRQAHAETLRRAELEERVRQRTAALDGALAEKQQLVEQKDLLIREVHHRVKNSLQLVASMLSLQAAGNADPELRRQLGEAGRRVRSVAEVHDLLHQVQDLRSVPFDAYVHSLCAEMRQSALPPDGGWALECHTDPVDLPADQAIPLGIIAGELLLNAGKYAYPADRSPKPVAVTVRHLGEHLSLTVADQGVGLPADFATRPHASLGMRLVTALVGQLRGRLDVEDRPQGTAFTVTVPLG